MDNVKINLTIILPGATMYDKSDCLKPILKEFCTKNGKKFKRMVKVEDHSKTEKFHFDIITKQGSKPQTEHFVTTIRKNIPCKQSINISQESYYYYINKKEIPEFEKKFVWEKMSNKERLEAHLKEIAAGLGGTVLAYHVFED